MQILIKKNHNIANNMEAQILFKSSNESNYQYVFINH